MRKLLDKALLWMLVPMILASVVLEEIRVRNNQHGN